MENEIEQISQMLELSGQLKLDEMSMKDAVEFLSVITEYAERVKPLVVKYILKNGIVEEKSNFLFKL